MAGYTAGTLSVTGGGSTAPTADLPVVCISAKAPDGLLRCTRNNTTRRRITENVLRGAHQGTDETAAFSRLDSYVSAYRVPAYAPAGAP